MRKGLHQLKSAKMCDMQQCTWQVTANILILASVCSTRNRKSVHTLTLQWRRWDEKTCARESVQSRSPNGTEVGFKTSWMAAKHCGDRSVVALPWSVHETSAKKRGAPVHAHIVLRRHSLGCLGTLLFLPQSKQLAPLAGCLLLRRRRGTVDGGCLCLSPTVLGLLNP